MLSNEQLGVFDTVHVSDENWLKIRSCIELDFPDGRFTFLDLGGGNGLFADRVLNSYPEARGTVLDNSELLLNRNSCHPNKRLILGSVANLKPVASQKYDIIFLNWLLHHLVGNSYAESRQNMEWVLTSCRSLLTERGRLSVCENFQNGLLIDAVPSWLVFQLTSTRKMASWVRLLGANSAGVGICALSLRQWEKTFLKLGFTILAYSSWNTKMSWAWRIFLLMRNCPRGHIWLSTRQSPTPPNTYRAILSR